MKMMTCPECEKRGVSLRLRAAGEDHFGCRYCDWHAFASGYDEWDVVGRRQLRRINPDHLNRPSQDCSY